MAGRPASAAPESGRSVARWFRSAEMLLVADDTPPYWSDWLSSQPVLSQGSPRIGTTAACALGAGAYGVGRDGPSRGYLAPSLPAREQAAVGTMCSRRCVLRMAFLHGAWLFSLALSLQAGSGAWNTRGQGSCPGTGTCLPHVPGCLVPGTAGHAEKPHWFGSRGLWASEEQPWTVSGHMLTRVATPLPCLPPAAGGRQHGGVKGDTAPVVEGDSQTWLSRALDLCTVCPVPGGLGKWAVERDVF